MRTGKVNWWKLCLLALLTIAVLAGCGRNAGQLEEELKDFRQALTQEGLDGMRLKVYYIDPGILTYAPFTVDELINCSFVNEITVDNAQLREHADLLRQVNADNLVPVTQSEHNLDARLCYIFETDTRGKVLEVAFCGEDRSAFVNGVEVAYSSIFPDIIAPFVTEDTMVLLEHLFNGTLYISE